MRNFLTVLLISFGLGVGAQSLTNTCWYFLKSELPGFEKKSEPVTQQILLFGDQEVKTYQQGIILTVRKAGDTSGLAFMSIIPKEKESQKYKVNGDKLVFSPSGASFTVLFHDDTLLVVQKMIRMPSGQLNGDVINYYIRSDYYYDYLLENNLLRPENSLCLEASRILFPVYLGDYFADFGKNLSEYFDQDTMSGRITLNEDGRVTDISFSSTQINNGSVKVKALRDAFIGSNGKWILPEMKGNCMEVDFFLNRYKWWDSGKNPLVFKVKVMMLPDSIAVKKFEPVESYSDALEYFESGINLSNREKYLEAVRMFDKSIEMNPNYSDAYFNKAIALFKLGRKEEACAIWKNLASKGDLESERLYKMYCNSGQIE